MKLLKQYLLACIMIGFGVNKVYAQYANQIRPSVNAGQFLSAVSKDIGLHTGQLSVNIPLFNLASKGINVPISISFCGAGITNESEASNIGLGWSLLAGGCITRTIRDYDDLSLSSASDFECQYNENFIQNKVNEQSNNPESDNLFDMAMGGIYDKEPDIVNYSFLGYSGDICFRFDANKKLTGKLYPDKSFKIERTSLGFKIVDNNGTNYFFESKELNSTTATTWFLTKIVSIQGGQVTFSYDDEEKEEFTNQISASDYAHFHTKRLVRIDFDLGCVILKSAQRDDVADLTKASKRITNIELYNKAGSLIKGFEFGNNSYVLDDQSRINKEYINTSSKRMELSSVREYNKNNQYLPPYEFDYDYYFYLPKNSAAIRNDIIHPENGWARDPVSQCIVDRTYLGDICSWVERVPTGPYFYEYNRGFDFKAGESDGYTMRDFFCLKKITYPTGGSESYEYEKHDYSLFTSQSSDTIGVSSSWKGDLPSGSYDVSVKGRRIKKKEIVDGNGNKQIVEYGYCLHDAGYYQIKDYYSVPVSSGVLACPSIYYSTMYEASFDDNYARLVASPYHTTKPQNMLSGAAVYYTQVEEVFKTSSGTTNGKKIYYFDKGVAVPAVNYIYLNYGKYGYPANYLLNVPNTLYGCQKFYPNSWSDEPYKLTSNSEINYTYLAYPVGAFYHYNPTSGKAKKIVTIDANGNVVSKTENKYIYISPSETLYGLVFHRFTDSYYSSTNPSDRQHYRYLISRYELPFGVANLDETTTTNYYSDLAKTRKDSITVESTYDYSSLNLLRSSSLIQSNGKTVLHKYLYPIDYADVTSGFIKAMKDFNIINKPIEQYTLLDDKVIEGALNTFKTDNNVGFPDITYKLETTTPLIPGSTFVPSNNSGSNFSIGAYYKPKIYNDMYSDGNLMQYHDNSDLNVSYIWGYNNTFPIVKAENCTYTDLKAAKEKASYYYDAIENPEKNISMIKKLHDELCKSLPNAHITIYTYDPLVGMTSQTDPRGITTYFNYDNFNRLQNIKDNNGKYLNEYRYHYINEQ